MIVTSMCNNKPEGSEGDTEEKLRANLLKVYKKKI